MAPSIPTLATRAPPLRNAACWRIWRRGRSVPRPSARNVYRNLVSTRLHGISTSWVSPYAGIVIIGYSPVGVSTPTGSRDSIVVPLAKTEKGVKDFPRTPAFEAGALFDHWRFLLVDHPVEVVVAPWHRSSSYDSHPDMLEQPSSGTVGAYPGAALFRNGARLGRLASFRPTL